MMNISYTDLKNVDILDISAKHSPSNDVQKVLAMPCLYSTILSPMVCGVWCVFRCNKKSYWWRREILSLYRLKDLKNYMTSVTSPAGSQTFNLWGTEFSLKQKKRNMYEMGETKNTCSSTEMALPLNWIYVFSLIVVSTYFRETQITNKNMPKILYNK